MPATTLDHTGPSTDRVDSRHDGSTSSIHLIAVLLAFGAAWQLAPVVVPFAMAVILAMILAPLANKVERAGAPAPLGSLAALLLAVAALVATFGLITYHGSSLLSESDEYLARVGRLLDDAQTRLHLPGQSTSKAPAPTDWTAWLRQHSQTLGEWAARGLGGVLGFAGQSIVVLAFMYYMLATRLEWRGRVERVLGRLGLGPARPELREAQREVRLYARFIGLVAIGVAVLVSILAWAVGLPSPVAWGVLAGLMEFVPFFGPLLAGSFLTLLTVATHDGWWAPVTVLVCYAVMQNIEGYVITPMLYGKAVRLNPVLVLLGVMIFGFIWGPAGLVLAVPMMILLKTLIDLSPDTPALDALVEERPAHAS